MPKTKRVVIELDDEEEEETEPTEEAADEPDVPVGEHWSEVDWNYGRTDGDFVEACRTLAQGFENPTAYVVVALQQLQFLLGAVGKGPGMDDDDVGLISDYMEKAFMVAKAAGLKAEAIAFDERVGEVKPAAAGEWEAW